MVEFVFMLIITLLFGLVISIGVLLQRKLFGEEEPKNLPNGSMGWPLLGENIGFLKSHRSTSLGAFLQQHCSRHGKVFKSNLFGSPTIVSCDHELNTFILQNEERLFLTHYPQSLKGILGKYSILIATGDLHKKLRSFAVNFSVLSKSRPEFLLSIEKHSISMMESWKGHKEIPFYKEIKRVTLNLMVKSMLSLDAEDPVALQIKEDYQKYMTGFVSLPIYFPGTAYFNGVKARARLASTMKRIIKEREMEKKNERRQLYNEGDYLDVIMSKQNLILEETISNVLDILLGGYETTATLLSLIVYFMGQNPKAYQALKEEHQEIRKKKEYGAPLDLDDFQQMKFTNNVIYEALRCGNVVKFLHRKATRDVQFKGYSIPAGWQVLPVLSAVHLDSSLHENPAEFNPWRWADQSTMKKVMPFGGGLRFCPGAEIAKVELAFILHHLVLRYRWKMKPDDIPIAYPYVEFKRGLLLEIEPCS